MNSPDNERNNEGAIVAKILKIPICQITKKFYPALFVIL